MSPAAHAKDTMAGKSADSGPKRLGRQASPALTEFGRIYDDNADVVMAYFARRCSEPQTVADLTSETFVRAIGAFGTFDPRRGSPRAWLFGIAGNVFAQYCAETANGRTAVARLQGRRALEVDEIGELADKIDAERDGRALIKRCSELSPLERAALELVDLSGLTPKEAAAALSVSRIVLRKRLSRARARLRKEHGRDE